ncbi:MAG: sensor histidine kinase [Verrucomicrobiota bacterium]|nr:sensor histidine kinase [Verrucomicrobiota bacterium]
MKFLKEQSVARAGLVAGTYMVLSGSYIIVSSMYAEELARSVENLAHIETIKGILFVLITGIFLFIFTENQFRRAVRQQKVQQEQRFALLKSEQRAIAVLYASALAHDASNMLAAVGMGLELLRQKGPLTDGQVQSLDAVKSAIVQLGAINQRLIGGDRRATNAVATTVGIHDQIMQAIGFVRMHDHLRTKHLTVDCQKDFTVTIDPLMLQQAMVNLILNAGEATSALGKIKVVIQEERSRGVIEVHDDGPGIAEEMQAALFQPMQSSKPGGHGLGLVAVKGFVELCKGEIAVTTSPMGGACFRLSLPLK